MNALLARLAQNPQVAELLTGKTPSRDSLLRSAKAILKDPQSLVRLAGLAGLDVEAVKRDFSGTVASMLSSGGRVDGAAAGTPVAASPPRPKTAVAGAVSSSSASTTAAKPYRGSAAASSVGSLVNNPGGIKAMTSGAGNSGVGITAVVSLAALAGAVAALGTVSAVALGTRSKTR